MRFALSLALLAIPLGAAAGPGTEPVIGGSAAPAGKWPDAAAVLWSGDAACTGTLIAPTVVMTAGHCVEFGAPDAVLLGATAKSRPQEGETIAVTRSVPYPDSQNTIDIAVLVLAEPATTPPRMIASGWARADIKNGAQVQLVGYGTTDRNGNVETDSLMEATSSITDFNCMTSSGCNVAARPEGELGAGGMGIDTCPGDSGGPLYLLTDYGAFLAGVTSRGYNNNQYFCSEGGIYGRPDKALDWIETAASVKLERAPGPTAEPIMATRGRGAETKIATNDPKAGAKHTFAIATQPAYGAAAVSDSGVVRVCPQDDVVGDDSVVVSISDASDPGRTLTLRIPVIIADGDPEGDCDPTDFGGGCCDTRRSATGSIPLALIVVVVLRPAARGAVGSRCMAETWLKCSACKNPIPFHATHWVCSVSTCNRKATGYVFCTVSCWDSHVAEARHRDAWAVEARAPSKEAWDRELAASPPPPVAAKPAAPTAPPVRRVVGEPSPSTAAAVEGNVKLVEVTDKDVLIVVSKLKKYIKDRSGFNTSDAVVDVLSDHVRAICDDAIRAAARDERKTVLDRDVPRPRR